MLRVKHPISLVVAFVVGAAACFVVGVAGGSALAGMLGVASPHVAMGVVSAVSSGLLLCWSALLLRQRGESLAALGLPVNRSRLGMFGSGLLVGVAIYFVVASLQATAVGAPWQFNGLTGVLDALSGLPVVASMVLAEELLFRGVGLLALRKVAGDRAAIILSATCFGAYHLIGSGYWGMGAVFHFGMPALTGLLFGWSAIRSGGLALPIGLHLGANWVQANLVVFHPASAVPGSLNGVFLISIGPQDVQRLIAPDLVTHIPHLMALSLGTAAVWMICRRHPSRGPMNAWR